MSRAAATAALTTAVVALAAGTASAAPASAAAAPSTPVGQTVSVKPTAGAVAGPLKPIDWQGDFNSNLAVAATNFGLATGIGGLVGGVAGVVLGCPLGAVTGGLAVATTVIALPTEPLAVALGCLVGAATIGSIGPIVGGAVVGIPVGIASAVQMYNTMHAAGEVAAPIPAHG